MCMRACKRAPEATETDHAAPPHPPLCSAAGIVSTNSLYPDEFTPDGAGEPRWGTRVGPGVVAQVRAPAARTHPLARCTSPHACTAWLRASAMPAAVSCATAAAKPPCGRAPHPHLAPPPPPPPPFPPPCLAAGAPALLLRAPGPSGGLPRRRQEPAGRRWLGRAGLVGRACRAWCGCPCCRAWPAGTPCLAVSSPPQLPLRCMHAHA